MPDRHRRRSPEDYGRKFTRAPQWRVPVTDVFQAGVWLHLLETGIRAIKLSTYHADLPARHPVRLGTAAGFLACYFPPVILSDRSKPSDPEIISSHPCPLRGRYDTAPRGAAKTHSHHRWPSLPAMSSKTCQLVSSACTCPAWRPWAAIAPAHRATTAAP